MGQVSLSLSIEQVTGSVAVMGLEGTVVADAEAAMAEALEQAAAEGARSIVLDFSRVSGIDSGGASALVKLWALSKSRRMSLSAIGLDGRTREILDLTQLAGVMPLFDDLSQALAAAGAGTGIPVPRSCEEVRSHGGVFSSV